MIVRENRNVGSLLLISQFFPSSQFQRFSSLWVFLNLQEGKGSYPVKDSIDKLKIKIRVVKKSKFLIGHQQKTALNIFRRRKENFILFVLEIKCHEKF